MKQLIDRVDARLDAWGAALKERELRFPSDLTAGIVFALVGIVLLLAMPSQITVGGNDVVDGRAFPTLLMVVMLVGCASLIGKELVKLARKQPIAWKTVNLLVEVKALVILDPAGDLPAVQGHRAVCGGGGVLRAGVPGVLPV